MVQMSFDDAMETVIRQAMTNDERILILGEDVQGFRRGLFAQFGKKRVRNTPISEAGFVSAAHGAAMAGLRPIVEVMLVDFLGVAIDPVLNHVAKTFTFSGNQWNVPLIIRVSCGGGYGDGGQHEQALWGWLAHIPGLIVMVPSTPADAGALMMTAINAEHPVIFFEHKMLSDFWLGVMGIGNRETVSFDVPQDGRIGKVPKNWEPVEIGTASLVRSGSDISVISLGLSVHYCLQIAEEVSIENISVEVIDLRFVTPIDIDKIITSVKKTGKVLIVDEDYSAFGLTGEITALLLERDISFRMRRVATKTTIPYDHQREKRELPNKETILQAIRELVD